jgi:nitrogen fixation NifU-like protein
LLELDDFIKEIQREIHEETRKAYGKLAFERWLRPQHVGVMDSPDGYGHVAGSCGDRIEVYLRFEEDKVKEATFRTDACGSSQVCGSFAAELAFGKTPDEVAEISGETILKVLGGLSEEDRHCGLLAAEALQEALDGYMSGHSGLARYQEQGFEVITF